MLAVVLATVIGRGRLGVVSAPGGASAALTDVLQLVLDLRQPAAQLRVLRLQVGDPLLEGGNEGQDGGLGLGWDRLPQRCGDRWSRSHTLYYDASVQMVRPWDGSSCQNSLTVTDDLPGEIRCTACLLRHQIFLARSKITDRLFSYRLEKNPGTLDVPARGRRDRS